MSCSTCKKVKVIEPDKSGLQYTLVPNIRSLMGRDGKLYPINASLIPRLRSPIGGWGVELYIHGQHTTINGSRAAEIFLNSKAILDLNEISYTDPNLWFNLNIQWVSRAIDKYQHVKLDQLLEIATPNY